MEEMLDLHPSAVHSTITVSNAVKTLSDASTSPLVSGMRRVLIQVDPSGGNVRMTLDGSTDPVGATTGIRYDAGDVIVLERTEAFNAKFIRDASTDATLQIQPQGSRS